MSNPTTPTSRSATIELEPLAWPALPTETEIYILPDGRVIIADLPAEFAHLLAELGATVADTPPTHEQ
jgi:hypothetical protein